MTDRPANPDHRTILSGLVATGLALGLGSIALAKAPPKSDYDLARELYRYAFSLIFFGRYRHNSPTAVDTITRQPVTVNQWSHNNCTVTPGSTGAPQTALNRYAISSRSGGLPFTRRRNGLTQTATLRSSPPGLSLH